MIFGEKRNDIQYIPYKELVVSNPKLSYNAGEEQ